ncbi:hypothetical protein BT69DRAFT_1319917 [Atractiella rhizophila]|nr:hypothetical protein BT69DRAFT_1319917 [Atractiella rhizophila]
MQAGDGPPMGQMPPFAQVLAGQQPQGMLMIGGPSGIPHTGTTPPGAPSSVKRSQRPSWSCTECTRRKIKCDKVIPCQPCTKRGKADECHLEPFEPRTKAKYNLYSNTHPPDPTVLPPTPSNAIVTLPSLQHSHDSFRLAVHNIVNELRGEIEDLRAKVSRLEKEKADISGVPNYTGKIAAEGKKRGRKKKDDFDDWGGGMGGGTSGSDNGPNNGNGYSMGANYPPSSSEGPPPGSLGSGTGFQRGRGFDASLDMIMEETGPRRDRLPRDSQHFATKQEENEFNFEEDKTTRGDGTPTEKGSEGMNEESEAAVTLEYLALGRDRRQGFSTATGGAATAVESPEEEESMLNPEARETLRQEQQTNSSDGSGLTPTMSLLTPQRPPASLEKTSSTSSNSSGKRKFGTLPPISSLLPDGLQTSSPNPYLSQPIFENVLPNKTTCDKILEFSLTQVLWQHACVHAPTFRREVAEFWQWEERKLEIVHQCWLALFWTMLCVGVRSMNKEEFTAAGFAPDQYKTMPKVFYNAAWEALHRGDWMGKHSIFTLQTIAIMVTCCHEVGGSESIGTLLGAGLKIAQSLNLHRLGKDVDWKVKDGATANAKQLVGREIRKRVWWAMINQDWFNMPYRYCCSSSPAQFDTDLPANAHDEDLDKGYLNVQPRSIPTIASKLITQSQLATFTRNFFEQSVQHRHNPKAAFKACKEVHRELLAFIEDAPEYLKGVGTPDPSWPPYVAWQGHAFRLSAAHKLILIHRPFLQRAFQEDKEGAGYEFSRKACLTAADMIYGEFIRPEGTHGRALWQGSFHVVAATTVLCINLLTPEVQRDVHEANKCRERIRVLLQGLQASSNSSEIARRGVVLVENLLKAEAEAQQQPRALKRRAGDEDEIDDNRGGKRMAIDYQDLSQPLDSSGMMPQVPLYPPTWDEEIVRKAIATGLDPKQYGRDFDEFSANQELDLSRANDQQFDARSAPQFFDPYSSATYSYGSQPLLHHSNIGNMPGTWEAYPQHRNTGMTLFNNVVIQNHQYNHHQMVPQYSSTTIPNNPYNSTYSPVPPYSTTPGNGLMGGRPQAYPQYSNQRP